MEFLTAYTDGACSGNPGPGGWAAAIGDELGVGWMTNTTNNAMEMMAVLKGLEMCPPHQKLLIVTDSKLVIGWLERMEVQARANPDHPHGHRDHQERKEYPVVVHEGQGPCRQSQQHPGGPGSG